MASPSRKRAAIHLGMTSRSRTTRAPACLTLTYPGPIAPAHATHSIRIFDSVLIFAGGAEYRVHEDGRGM